MTQAKETRPARGVLAWYKSKSIRAKFLVVLIPVVVLALAVTAVVSVSAINRSVNSTLYMTLTETANLASQRVTDYLEVYRQLAIEIAQWTARLDADAVDLEELENIAARNGFAFVVSTDERGMSVRGADLSKEAYFTVVRDTRQAYISDVHTDSQLGISAVTIAAPILRGENADRFDGIIAAVIDAKLLSGLVKDVAIGSSGVSFMIDSHEVCIAHTDETLVGKDMAYLEDLVRQDEKYRPLINLWEKMAAGETGFDRYDYVNGKRIAAYAPIENTRGWSVAITVSADEFLAEASSAAVTTSILAAVFLAMVIGILLWFINAVTSRMGTVTNRLELLAQGDLTSPVTRSTAGDEIGRLADATETLVNELSDIINETKHVLSQMAAGNLNVQVSRNYPGDLAEIRTSLELNLTSLRQLIVKISRASEEVARGSAQMASGAAGLSQGAAEQASSIEELFSTISEIAQRASNIAAPSLGAEEDGEDAEEGMSEEERQKHREDAARTKMDKLILAMDRISNNSKQIKKISYSVESIASETNILALNASVEAAHAGDAGRGFGVIAAEIRQLAGKSREAVNLANQQAERIMNAVERGSHMVGDTEEAISSIVVALDQIKSALSQISNVIESTAATAEETAASSEELSAQADMLRETISNFQYTDSASKE